VVKIFLSDLTFNTTDVGLSPRYPLQVLRFPYAHCVDTSLRINKAHIQTYIYACSKLKKI
jgi:hypothetical protein